MSNQPDESPPVRILLVDDEKEFVQTLAERLETRGLRPSIAYDGEQALEMVARDEPEVMILDLKMPGIDGLEVLRRVGRSHPHIQVIMLTGHGSEADRESAEELGVFDYLHKPTNIRGLVELIQEARRRGMERKAAEHE
jgi:DNA-binding response OmpR family regulator